MNFTRSSGILLHPTSLPSRFGIGELGPEAHAFADFLRDSGQRVWQVLPLGPTGYGDSPYQCFSAFAGNPLLISIDRLVERGYLNARDVADPPAFPTQQVDYGAVIAWKLPLLHQAFEAFRRATAEQSEFADFCQRHAHWLDDYALFMALKQAHDLIIWLEWDRA
ncbi:MAG: 4-alpha-glucanotransferase, partial [Candidatus Korobacteraceae bacterium]